MSIARSADPPTRAQYMGGNSHEEPWYFLTNGTSNPTIFSANLQQVIRVNDATDAWYRLTFRDSGSYNNLFYRSPAIDNQVGTQRHATYLTNGVPTVPAGLAAVDPTRELDVGVWVSGATVYINNIDSVRVYGLLWLDLNNEQSTVGT